jgi:hypothetical protein
LIFKNIVSYNLAGVPFVSNNFANIDFNEYLLELKIKITSDLSPVFKLLTYIVINEEIIPDSLNINVKKCLENKVI